MEYHAVVERDLTSIFIDMKGNEKMKKKKSRNLGRKNQFVWS